MEKNGKTFSNFVSVIIIGIPYRKGCRTINDEPYAEMAKFVGDFRARLDDKGRLVFPSAYKSVMDEGEPMRFIVKKDSFDPCLTIYAYSEWERMSEEIKSRLNLFLPEHNRFWRKYMDGRALVEPDPKLGRITIPKTLLEKISVKKDVIFKGLDHKIELWAPEVLYAESEASPDEAELTVKFLGQN